jgi:hypothetical protein
MYNEVGKQLRNLDMKFISPAYSLEFVQQNLKIKQRNLNKNKKICT